MKTWRRLQKLETRCWGTPNPRHLFLPTTDCVWWHGRFVYGAKEILLSLSIQRHDSSLRQACASAFYENKHSSGFYLQYAWPSHHAMEQLFVRPTKAGTVRSCGWREGAALDNCYGFIDGTVRPICRPQDNQRVVHNGHKRVHAIKFQSVTAPSGMIAQIYGPVGKYQSG